jgi:predicted transcriptional regulator
MARPASSGLTDREAQIMDILWREGSATAETVREALPDNPHDSTVRTMLRVLKDKGYVRIRGRQPAVYVPRVGLATVQTKAAKNLVSRFFGGSVETLVLRLVEDEGLSQNDLDHLRQLLSSAGRKQPRASAKRK